MTTLHRQLVEQLRDLHLGHPFNRPRIIDLLTKLEPIAATAVDQPTEAESTSSEVVLKKEGTPVRFAVKNWGQYSGCKRCASRDVSDGDMIVRIYGTGWWHDRCYRIVNPSFYEGLAD